jgi:putative transposase
MGKLLRSQISVKNGWYHVYNRGVNKEPIFLFDENYGEFIGLLNLITDRFKIEIHAFCLMANHFHLLVRTPDANISKAIGYLSARYATSFNKTHNRIGPLFQGRFKSKLILCENYLHTACRYIHQNPVQSGYVKNPENYEWSSYSDYLNHTKTFKWLNTSKIFNSFETKKESDSNPITEFEQFTMPVISKS